MTDSKKVWHPIETPPPERQLVLVDMGFYGVGLRSRVDDGWWDENENFDDSGIVYQYWAEIPNPPET